MSQKWIAAGAAALAVILLGRRKAKAAGTAPFQPPGPGPGDEPGEAPDEPAGPPPGGGAPPPAGTPSYVGYDRAHNNPNAVFDWPRKDLFPTEADFAGKLTAMGYFTPNQDPISGSMMRRTKTFQRDYNVVRADWLKKEGKPVGTPIAEDGLIGNATVHAMAWAWGRHLAKGPFMGQASMVYQSQGKEYPGLASL